MTDKELRKKAEEVWSGAHKASFRARAENEYRKQYHQAVEAQNAATSSIAVALKDAYRAGVEAMRDAAKDAAKMALPDNAIDAAAARLLEVKP